MATQEGAQSVRHSFDHASTLPRKPSLANPDECRMYFIAGAGLIKIGISTNVQSRFRAIRNSSPVPVELVAVTRGRMAYETDLRERPNYHDGKPRPSWNDLSEIAQWSWERSPYPLSCAPQNPEHRP